MKRRINIIISCLLIMVFTIPLFACNSCSSPIPEVPPAGISLNKTTLDTLIGDTNLLYIKEGIDSKDVTWIVSDDAIVTVDEGLVVSQGVGTATITATYGEYSALCTVNVSIGSQNPSLLIKNEKNSYTIGRCESNFMFEPYILFNGKNFNNLTVDYQSSNTDIASFDENGKLLIKDTGEIIVTICATWCGVSGNELSSLIKVVKINIIDEVYFYINNVQYESLNLSTLSEFEGKSYIDKIDFNPSVSVNGVTSNEVNVEIPTDLLEIKEGTLYSTSYGEGNILFSYIDSNGVEYNGMLPVIVTRPKAIFNEHINYFSSYSGMFKDENNGLNNMTIAKKVFGKDNVEGFTAKYDGVELETKNGKIFGMPSDINGAYDAVITVETPKVVYDVNVSVYAIVVSEARDLELFALKTIKEDVLSTYGIDETEITCIDGYSILLNDIDASGITIPHEIFNRTFSYVDANGVSSQTKIDGVTSRYNNNTKSNSTYDAQTKKFGFVGTFDGNGHTIFNLDTSVDADKVGGGLFGYIMGNARLYNFALVDMKISNSSGIAYAQSITSGRVVPQDKRGLRTNNTEIHDVYIKLSEDTINPKGALFYRNVNTLGLINLNNVIVDATGIARNSETSGGILIYDGVSLCAQNINNRFYSKDVYLISDIYPASFNQSAIVYGENLANGAVLDGQTSNSSTWTVVYSGNVYSSKFKQYSSINEMKNAELNYDSFDADVWNFVDGYPEFKTARGVYVNYNNKIVMDGTIKVNSVTDGNVVSLTNAQGEPIEIIEFIYDSSKLNISSDGRITLAQALNDSAEYELVLKCIFNNKEKEIKLKVLAYPQYYTLSNEIELSAYDGIFKIADYVVSPGTIVSAVQSVNGQSYNLSIMDNGMIKGLRTIIKSDYSDVEKSELYIITEDMEYKFTNVKVYSHIITEAEDLSVFRHTQSTGRVTGYYVLGGNVNATGYNIGHDDSLFSTTAFDSNHAFQGVFDGRGFAIYSFMPTISGLFGAVYSDTPENGGKTVIRNVGFVNMLSKREQSFTVFGAFIHAQNAVNEVKNVHVQIANTYVSEYQPTVNYKGLFKTNYATSLNTFKFTNIYVTIENEEFVTDYTLYREHGSILSRDTVGVSYNGTLDTRSARFNNVVTVTSLNPCAYRQHVNNKLAEEFDYRYMYVVYAHNDAGREGMRFIWLPEGQQYAHNPISENGTNGSFLYKNVYRYDAEKDVEASQITAFTQTGLWKVSEEGTLEWASVNSYKGTEDGANFNPDWIITD